MADPGTAPFRENHDILLAFQHGKALVECGLDLLATGSAADRNALCKITDNREKEIPLEIRPFRNVPGERLIAQKKTVQRRDGIGQDGGIDHRQMIRTNDPRPFMDFEELVAFVADPANVPDSVTRKAYGKIYQWTDNNNGDSAESVLQS